jgi:hypothetical protein
MGGGAHGNGALSNSIIGYTIVAPLSRRRAGVIKSGLQQGSAPQGHGKGTARHCEQLTVPAIAAADTTIGNGGTVST